jgi:hypothetical protein
MRQANVAKMGDQLGAVYTGLWQDIAGTHVCWLEYVELFETKKARIELMNRVAPRFFRIIQDELWDMSLLHLARITDPAFTFAKPDKLNRTINALSVHVTEAKVKAELENAVMEALNATKFARDWRTGSLRTVT